MTDAEVIILDEVFNGLDEESRTKTEFLLSFLTNITFIIISHMPIEKMRFTQKYILKNGHLELIQN
jgi:ABC-type multidrug transport system ATPase subunit